MDCKQARHLFDAYLDGELSPALKMELGAHRLKCSECRRALALLEVSGHVLSSDRLPVALREGFTDRLLSCMDSRQRRWTNRMRRLVYVGGPLAAAAVIALAFLGVFDRHGETKVAGRIVEPLAIESPATVWDIPVDERLPDYSASPDKSRYMAPNRGDSEIQAERENGEFLQTALDLTVLQLLDILEKAKDAPKGQDPIPGVQSPNSKSHPDGIPEDPDDVEDL